MKKRFYDNYDYEEAYQKQKWCAGCVFASGKPQFPWALPGNEVWEQ